MINTETIERSEKKGNRILKKLAMFGVAMLCCLVATASSSWLSSEKVVAVGGVPIIVNKVTVEDINNAKKKRDAAKEDAKKAKQKIADLKNQKEQISGELSKLNQANAEQKAQYELIASQLEAALDEKAAALDEYIEAQENLEKQQKLFTDRITIMFEYQNKSTLEVLLESDSIAGFFTNMQVISLIADSDAQAVDMLQSALDDAELQADLKLKHAEEMQAIADEKKRQLDELEKLIGQTEETLSNVDTDIDSMEKMEDELEKEAKKLEDKIKSLQTQYNKENAATGGGGAGTTKYNSKGTKEVGGVTWRWPTYCTSITSYYGYRIHPVYKTKKFHSGVDIGAGYGDTIMAAASGTVILVSEPVEGKNKGGSGYGNYCIIDHGNGYSTLYGHARDIYVKVGQKVSRGKAIGEVGSTGTSTGAHLHFEVRVNGSTTNPLNYLP
ncbi:murein DD-endopeptidase MepM/ murein hydrolase activator NlpD [Ruminococcaceae bacterium R-25]|nr:murein DD-endopeptidase MepM/ murein hydrolase activator NlpD [Ruminococcaceae bacterium R-25]SUQ22478.1 Murein DD-endopeptidase MepM and murein hydrolase activator NlpD, contain LysM domain [Oscillospiraceae bacterium]